MLDFWSLPILDPSADPLPDLLVNTVETIQFCVFCCTVPFYIFIIYFIIDGQSRKVASISTPFFKLWLITSFIDLAALLNNYFGSMFRLWGWGINVYLYLDEFFSHTYYYIAVSLRINQAMSAAVLTLNRVSAILFSHKYAKLWTRKNVSIAIFLQLAPGMIVSSVILFDPTKFYRTKTGGLGLRLFKSSTGKILYDVLYTFLILICVFLAVCYCYLLYAMRKRERRKLANNASAQTREYKLLIMSSIIVSNEFINLVVTANNMFGFVNISIDMFQFIYNVICDIYSSINPYLLWIFSDTLRDYILNRIGIKKTTKVSAPVITLSSRL